MSISPHNYDPNCSCRLCYDKRSFSYYKKPSKCQCRECIEMCFHEHREEFDQGTSYQYRETRYIDREYVGGRREIERDYELDRYRRYRDMVEFRPELDYKYMMSSEDLADYGKLEYKTVPVISRAKVVPLEMYPLDMPPAALAPPKTTGDPSKYQKTRAAQDVMVHIRKAYEDAGQECPLTDKKLLESDEPLIKAMLAMQIQSNAKREDDRYG